MHTIPVATNWDQGNNGVMWDVVALKDLTIKSISFNMNGCGVGASYEYELFVKDGTSNGYATNSGPWSIACSDTVTCTGDSLNANTGSCPISFVEGETKGLYLRALTRGILQLSNTDNVGDVYSEDLNLQALVGQAISGDFASDDGNSVPDAEIHYSLYVSPSGKFAIYFIKYYISFPYMLQCIYIYSTNHNMGNL